MVKKYFDYRILLCLIVILGFALRFYQLGQVPNGLDVDEAAYGYNAYSLLKTGRDEYGIKLPLVLKSYSDYKPALYSYLDILFVYSLGLNSISVRFPSVLFGVLTVLLLYFFTLELTKNKKVAISSAFLLAISPWHLAFSRTATETNVSLFFLILMSFALLKIINSNQRKKRWAGIAILCALLAIGTYTAARVFVIIAAFLFFLSYLRVSKNKIRFNTVLLLIFIVVSAISLIYNHIAGIARFNQLSIFATPGTGLVMEEQIREDHQQVPIVITRVFHNKLVNYSRTVLHNLGQYFTLDFLGLSGGMPLRQNIPDSGLFYLWELPFLFIGIYYLFRNFQRSSFLLIGWWLMMLIPAAFTFDKIPNTYRSLIVLPVIIIIISLGIDKFFTKTDLRLLGKSAKLIIVFLVLVAVYEFFYFEHQYFIHQNVHRPWYREYAYKRLVADVKKYYPGFSKIVITKAQSEPYIYFLFYNKYDPAKYQREGSPGDQDYASFDKYYFTAQDCPLNGGAKGGALIKGKSEYLYIDNGTCTNPANAKVLDIVKWGDGSKAFKIMRYLPLASRGK